MAEDEGGVHLLEVVAPGVDLGQLPHHLQRLVLLEAGLGDGGRLGRASDHQPLQRRPQARHQRGLPPVHLEADPVVQLHAEVGQEVHLAAAEQDEV